MSKWHFSSLNGSNFKLALTKCGGPELSLSQIVRNAVWSIWKSSWQRLAGQAWVIRASPKLGRKRSNPKLKINVGSADFTFSNVRDYPNDRFDELFHMSYRGPTFIRPVLSNLKSVSVLIQPVTHPNCTKRHLEHLKELATTIGWIVVDN